MRRHIISIFLLLATAGLWAHPMPASVVRLSVMESSIKGEAKMPLPELESALKLNAIKQVDNAFFREYFTRHIRAVSQGRWWQTSIQSLAINGAQDSMVGKYRQVIVHFTMVPASEGDLRRFTFDYDAIIHQVITHKALVIVGQDWDNGIQTEENARQIGIIKLDIPTEKVYPLEVNLEEGSAWKGFTSMLQLGMQHIKEGTDHLLFLIVLLLPAMLLPVHKKWGKFGGLKYSVRNLLKIVTAFTIGHSITLLLGALGLVRLPSQPVEILIACSILVSAVHAIYPIFPRRETWVAAGFGLIHGLGFATVLSGLDLGVKTLALSILGFNLGIEMMQLFIILMIVPWLILLSRTSFYTWFRIPIALAAGVAALGWISERVSGTPNFVTALIEKATPQEVWLIVGLAVVSVIISLVKRPVPFLAKPKPTNVSV